MIRKVTELCICYWQSVFDSFANILAEQVHLGGAN
jgi:hypothetical protein